MKKKNKKFAKISFEDDHRGVYFIIYADFIDFSRNFFSVKVVLVLSHCYNIELPSSGFLLSFILYEKRIIQLRKLVWMSEEAVKILNLYLKYIENVSANLYN